MASDTNVEIDEIYFKMLMDKTPEERLKMGLSMFDSAKKIVLSSIKNDENYRKELFLRFYADDFDEITKNKVLLSIKRC